MKTHLNPTRKGYGKCSYHITEHLSFLKRVKLGLNYFIPLILVRAILTLCHDLMIWITKEVFSNDC
jgi:hypothetical protein